MSAAFEPRSAPLIGQLGLELLRAQRTSATVLQAPKSPVALRPRTRVAPKAKTPGLCRLFFVFPDVGELELIGTTRTSFLRPVR